jgi:undecaprenyl phosphate N,N'-diacetylbacillosamine 1-phosphate transferase
MRNGFELFGKTSLKHIYRSYLKRFLDIFLSVVGLVLISPILLYFTALIYIIHNGSPFFLHERPGRNGRIFRLIKFKSMSDRRDAKGKLLPDVQRLTPVGRFMRSLSLDELPQLINVLKGDMSLIGPRPLLVCYLPLYNERQMRRQEVRPGMTGWAAVTGRNSQTWEQKLESDVWYVEHVSFILDLKILFMTVVKVLQRAGINDENNQMTKPFLGNHVK